MADEVAKPQKIGNFIILDKIGKGGMGAVYKAQGPTLDRTVALKLLPAMRPPSAGIQIRNENQING